MSQLFSQLKIGDLILKNRVVLAPLTRGRAGLSRVPNDIIKTYYEQRATAGLLITEATAVSAQGYGWYGAPGNYTEEQSLAWKNVVDGVHEKGGKIFLQLWHMGRQSDPTFHETNEVVAPSAIKVPGDGHVRNVHHEQVPYSTPRALLTEEIPAIVQDFKKSAALAKNAGFDGVEIHGANGYLIDTFLQSSTNLRTDIYGGSVENRYRLLGEVLEAVKEVYPVNRIGIRLSPNGVFGGMGSEDNDKTYEYVAKQLSAHDLAYLHVMDGLNFGFHNQCRPLTLFDFKSWFGGRLIGNITYTKDTAEGALRTGAVDLIAFGRPFISNPDLVERFEKNLPLNPDAPYSAWYDTHGGAKGYTDFPFYSESN